MDEIEQRLATIEKRLKPFECNCGQVHGLPTLDGKEALWLVTELRRVRKDAERWGYMRTFLHARSYNAAPAFAPEQIPSSFVSVDEYALKRQTDHGGFCEVEELIDYCLAPSPVSEGTQP